MAKRRRRSKRKSKRLIYIFLVGVFSIFIYLFFDWQKNHTTPQNLDLPKIPSGYKSYGIDISHHQGDIDWNLYKEKSDSLIQFIYCKATEGKDHIDKNWNSHRAFLEDAKILHGCYHFFRPQTDPIEQAEHFLSQYSNEKQALPPVLDSEIDAPKEELILKMKQWLKYVEEKTGRRPIIYTSNFLYNTTFKGNFEGYKFWIANYNQNGPDVHDPAIVMWQFTDKGSVPGIYGPVDVNYSKINYRD